MAPADALGLPVEVRLCVRCCLPSTCTLASVESAADADGSFTFPVDNTSGGWRGEIEQGGNGVDLDGEGGRKGGGKCGHGDGTAGTGGGGGSEGRGAAGLGGLGGDGHKGGGLTGGASGDGTIGGGGNRGGGSGCG
eukprot:5241081-Prymnesium_polylepis.2